MYTHFDVVLVTTANIVPMFSASCYENNTDLMWDAVSASAIIRITTTLNAAVSFSSSVDSAVILRTTLDVNHGQRRRRLRLADEIQVEC